MRWPQKGAKFAKLEGLTSSHPFYFVPFALFRGHSQYRFFLPVAFRRSALGAGKGLRLAAKSRQINHWQLASGMLETPFAFMRKRDN
jgi:hypothetical protein